MTNWQRQLEWLRKEVEEVRAWFTVAKQDDKDLVTALDVATADSRKEREAAAALRSEIEQLRADNGRLTAANDRLQAEINALRDGRA